MDLRYSPDEQRFRGEARRWLEANVPAEPLPDFDSTRAGFEAHRQWERTLHSGGWSAVTWPKDYGGRGLDLISWLIFEEEYHCVGAPGRVNQNGIFLLGPTLMEYGSEEQKRRFLPAMAAGDEIWAQAWSEPQAGSDLAAIRATATADGDDYLLNGHKIWSSRAVHADWAFGLFREPGTERHQGMSLIFFKLDSEGVRVSPIRRLDGRPVFAEIVLEDVRVRGINRLGKEGEGWAICMATAGFERGLMLRSPARFQAAAKALVALFSSRGEAAWPWRDQVLQVCMDADTYALSIYATASRLIEGERIGPEASTNKIFWSELDLDLHRTALSILGAEAELAAGGGKGECWLDGYVFSLAGPIYAGANEIQRDIIAERMLRMPKS